MTPEHTGLTPEIIDFHTHDSVASASQIRSMRREIESKIQHRQALTKEEKAWVSRDLSFAYLSETQIPEE